MLLTPGKHVSALTDQYVQMSYVHSPPLPSVMVSPRSPLFVEEALLGLFAEKKPRLAQKHPLARKRDKREKLIIPVLIYMHLTIIPGTRYLPGRQLQ